MNSIAQKIVFIGFFSMALVAQNMEDNIYTRTCIPCHEYMPSSLERMFMSYIKVYSGEITFKASLKGYLQEPNKETSMMSDLFIDTFGIKDKLDLNEWEIEDAIDIYWELYNVRNKLK